jgi:hypothetical protein
VHTGFWWEILREGDNLKDLIIEYRIILKWTIMKWNGGMD